MRNVDILPFDSYPFKVEVMFRKKGKWSSEYGETNWQVPKQFPVYRLYGIDLFYTWSFGYN